MKKHIIGLFPLIFLLASCSDSIDSENNEVHKSIEPRLDEQSNTVSNFSGDTESEGTLIPRSAYDKGKYYLLDKKQSGEILTTLHKRVGVDTIGYTLMNINCATAQVQELGYSEVSAEDITQELSNWYDLVPGSSKHDIYSFVCN